jgi:hypothetical protein
MPYLSVYIHARKRLCHIEERSFSGVSCCMCVCVLEFLSKGETNTLRSTCKPHPSDAEVHATIESEE